MKSVLLRITLQGIHPPIWRQIKISTDATLLDLHYVIQYAFGWMNSHLFLMKIGSMQFVNTPDWEEDSYLYQAAELAAIGGLIPKLVAKGGKFIYIYDMGDNWQHEILIEDIVDSPKVFFGAICLDGERACPPEDVGSVPGYYRLLEELRDPTSEDFARNCEWLGYVYNPEALDLETANLFIRDYFDAAQLGHDTLWVRDLPIYQPVFDFIHGWTDNPNHHHDAEMVPLRRDVVTLLTYLREHKVKGTKTTGYFPRKAIREMTAGFVEPPVLDQQIGDQLYKLRTESEVPDLLFIHNFVNLAGLVVGGENRLWRVTHLGEIFLERTPAEQVWFLTKFWFNDYVWDNCYPYDDVFPFDLQLSFLKCLMMVLLNYPSGRPVEIDQVLREVIRVSPPWLGVFDYEGRSSYQHRHYFDVIVVEPFYKLGLFKVVKKEIVGMAGFFHYTHIIMTDYGKTLLQFFVLPT